MKYFLFLMLSFVFSKAEKKYVKDYYDNGNVKEEGWMENNIKTDYWYFYFSNSKKSAEGSFINGSKNKYWKYYTSTGYMEKEGWYKDGLENEWWVFYDGKSVVKKVQFNNGKFHGYTIYYSNGDPAKVEKYVNGIKTGEWTDMESFKRDNW